MGILYIPKEKEIVGPWLLDLNKLEKLDLLIEDIKSKIKESASLEKKSKAQERFDSGGFDSLEDAMPEDWENSIFDKEKEEITLISRDDSKLTDSSLRNILIDSKIKSFSPQELNIVIQNGYRNEFHLRVSRRFDGDLKFKIKCFDQEIESHINYQLENWLDDIKPNRILQFWNKFYFVFVIASIFLCSIALTEIYDVETPNLINVYKDQIEKLLTDGIDDSNRDKATELILKLNSNYYPENIKSIERISTAAIRFAVLFFILIFISYFRPRTIIGLGKHKSKLNFYKKYFNFILISIPSIFFLPYIYDIIRKLMGLS